MVPSMSSPPAKTARHRWFDHLLSEKGHGSVKTFVLARRIEGTSWRDITLALNDVIGERISDQALLNWFRGDPEVQAATKVGETAGVKAS